MIEKRYQNFRGINLRNSILLVNENYASDLLNVELSRRASVVKRGGSTQLATGFGGNGLFNYYSGDQLIGVEESIKYYDAGWQDIPEGDSNLTAYSDRICNSQEINNNLYIASGDGDTYLHKYDGSMLYKAGLPPVIAPTHLFTPAAGGSLPDDTYYYVARWVHRDRNDNIVQGPVKGFGTVITSGANNSVNLSIIPLANHLTTPGLAGFHNRYAIADGLQVLIPAWTASFSIDIDAGSDLEVGDYCFLNIYDAAVGPNQYDYDFFKILSFNGAKTEVTFEGKVIYSEAPFQSWINVPDNSYLTSVGAVVYRSTTETTGFQQVLCVPNDPSDTTTDTYVDDFTSPTIDLEESASVYDRVTPNTVGLPPKGAYLTVHQGLLFISGKDDDKNGVSFSDPDSVEHFPEDTNQFITGDNEDGINTGLAAMDDYIISFQERAIHQITGTIALGDITVKRIEGSNIGCAANASIQEINNRFIFLSDVGIYSLIPGGRPEELGWPVNPLIVDDTTGLILSKAVSVHDPGKKQYILCIPAETTGVPNSYTRVIVYDYSREIFDEQGSFWVFDSQYMSGGMAMYEASLYWMNRSATNELYQRSTSFNDNSGAINAYYKSSWEHLGEPSIEKKFINNKVFALEGENYTLTVQGERDWKSGTSYTDAELVFDADNRFKKLKYNHNKAFSMRTIFSNNVVDEGLEITAFEYDIEAPYTKMKR